MFARAGFVPLTLALLVLAAEPVPDPNGVQFPPKPVTVEGKPIDTQRSGHAAPFLIDFSGKGTPDLVLGEFYGGRLWVYKNDGKPGQPKFLPREALLASGIQAAVETRCFSGTHPVLGDIRGTGKLDMIAVGNPGDVYLFRNTGDDTFSKPELLRDDRNQPIDVGWGGSPYLFDWGATGQLGLMMGNSAGEVHFLPRMPGKDVRFGPARALTHVDGKTLKMKGGYATPIIADWDGDGLPDLIVGAWDGSVTWYRNAGTRRHAALEAGRELVPASPGRDSENLRPGEWGRRVRPAVVDWHGRGRLDLIVGDYSGYTLGKPDQTSDEKREEKLATETLPGIRAEWAASLQKYRAAQVAPEGETATQKAEREERMATLRVNITLLQKAIIEAQNTGIKYREQYMANGKVWLFERNPAEGK